MQGRVGLDTATDLGTGVVSNQMRQYRDYPKARAFVRGLGLKSQAEWIDYCRSGKKPADIPAIPSRKYAGSGWIRRLARMIIQLNAKRTAGPWRLAAKEIQ